MSMTVFDSDRLSVRLASTGCGGGVYFQSLHHHREIVSVPGHCVSRTLKFSSYQCCPMVEEVLKFFCSVNKF